MSGAVEGRAPPRFPSRSPAAARSDRDSSQRGRNLGGQAGGWRPQSALGPRPWQRV